MIVVNKNKYPKIEKKKGVFIWNQLSRNKNALKKLKLFIKRCFLWAFIIRTYTFTHKKISTLTTTDLYIL